MNNSSNKLDFITQALNERREEHRFRRLSSVVPDFQKRTPEAERQDMLNFCSNDYLGLASHPEVISRSIEFSKKFGAGATSSRLISGTFAIHEDLERKLAHTFKTEAALLFNTGFQANATILATLADRNSLIIADKKVHNSLLQGAILSRAELIRFRHKDYEHLESILKKTRSKSFNRTWVVSETIFSMDGDRSDIDQLVYLSEKYNALLFSDDAHAVGVWGKKGLGLNYEKPGIHLSLGTFGKAFGSFGAFVSCSNNMKDYLVNFCPGFIYTTALPPSVVGAIDAALELIPLLNEKREHLKKNIGYLKKGLHESGFETGISDSQIIPVIIGDEERTLALSKALEKSGIWAVAVRPPTVEAGSSLIRITLTANHQREEINQLLDAFRNWKSA